MSRTQRSVIVAVLMVLSVGCAISFAMLLGSFAHIGQQVVASGGDSVSPPSASGWIALILSAVGAWMGGSWARWFAAAANALPAIENLAGKFPQLQELGSKVKALPLGPLGSLQTLLETLDVSSGGVVTSTGHHPVPGGAIEWMVKFTPATKPQN